MKDISNQLRPVSTQQFRKKSLHQALEVLRKKADCSQDIARFVVLCGGNPLSVQGCHWYN